MPFLLSGHIKVTKPETEPISNFPRPLQSCIDLCILLATIKYYEVSQTSNFKNRKQSTTLRIHILIISLILMWAINDGRYMKFYYV